MTLSFKVYDPTNTTLQGTLSQAFDIEFSSDLRVPLMLSSDDDLASTADQALLEPLNVVRVNDGTSDIEAYIIQDIPAEWAPGDEVPRRGLDCRHLLTWLGYGQGGAVLHPYGGLTGLQQSPRWFGPMGFDFPDLEGIPEPTTDGNPTRENWPDPHAERFVFDTRAVYRRVCTGSEEFDGEPTRMFFTTTAWTEAVVYFDGAELPALSTGVGDRTIRFFDIVYDGEDHVICFDAKGTPPAGEQNALAFVWAVVEADVNGEYNSPDIENPMFRSFNSSTYAGPGTPTEPFWQAWEDYDDDGYPGVTVGFAVDTFVTEAQARGLLTNVTTDFDADDDSDSTAWEYTFARGLPPQKGGPLLETMAPYGCEPEMTPAGVLKLHQLRGTDRTSGGGAVTLTFPFALSSTGRGIQATRYLTETQGGFGSATNSAAESALGVALEEFVSLGDDVHPFTVEEAVALQLAEDSSTRDDYVVDLPDDVVPYVDVFLGDRVNCQSTEDPEGATATMRIVTFTASVERNTGRTEWSAVLEPWVES